MLIKELLKENTEKLPDWYKSGAIVTLNPEGRLDKYKPADFKVKLRLSVNKKSGYSSCRPVEDGVFYPNFGGATYKDFVPVKGAKIPDDFFHPSDEAGIKKLWNDVFDGMYSATVMGLEIESVKVQANGDYTAVIGAEVKERQTSGVIMKKGDTLTMKLGRKFNKDISDLDFTDPDDAGETLTHMLDDRLF